MTFDDLKADVATGAVDTVLLAITDMQGRLQGKRMAASHFLDEVVDHAAEGCNYLLAVDVDMNTVDGYAMASWEKGYGDFVMVPDMSTLHRVPWHSGSVGVLADVQWADGSAVAASPRQILRRQLDRLAERGWGALAATELEFMLFDTTYEEAWDSGYVGLTPANRYNSDYSMLGTARVEPFIHRVRTEMAGAGLTVENSKGECNLGQHEVNFKYADALTAADQHSIYKNGVKEIAAQEGRAITFMAKFDEHEGNSCHIHLSVAGQDGTAVFQDEPDTFHRFLAGQLACLRELTMLLAPNINSYKRYADGSFAPTTVAWGADNRTCALRVVGHGPATRLECRAPGADVNPYLALAAMIAAGLHGVDHELPLEPALEGNAYAADDKPHLPTSLVQARELWLASDMVAEAFGADVVDHYANMAKVEIDAFGTVVTDWERVRGFERL